MNDKLIRSLSSQTADALVQRKLPACPNKKAAQALLRQMDYTQKLTDLLPLKDRLSPGAVLELCAPVMDELCPEPPQAGWGKFCYQFICSRMFPDGPFAPEKDRCGQAALFYLTVLQVLLDYERTVLPFDPLMDFQFLSEEQAAACDCAGEYRRFLSAWHNEFIYELMRLGQEFTPFRTLGHIAGVHHIAMTAAHGLAKAGVDVDLALISAAAATHDVGKFGCRPGERVPYLHYYYSDEWLTKRRMERVSQIASNHSTWDLELEALSVEGLLLIYADFRSKQDRDKDGNEITVLYPLDESFRVILSKLDNVDAVKRRRYEFVYGRLHDFEDYMRRLGVDVELSGTSKPPVPQKDAALMDPEETLDSLVLLSVEHNIKLMYMLSNEQRFGNIIESARSAKNWKQLRAYLNIFGEYFTYLSARQKKQALSFLYELLVHREGDIRRQAGGLIGQIIAKFHLVYQKEVPAHVAFDPAAEVPFELWSEYLDMIIYPDHKTTQQQRHHIGYTLKLVVDSMLIHARQEDIPQFLAILLDHYVQPEHTAEDTAFTLLDAIRYLPTRYYDDEMREQLIEFVSYFAAGDNLRLRTAALEYLREAQRSVEQGHPHMERIVEIARNTPGSELTTDFLRCKIFRYAGLDVTELEQRLYSTDITSEVFLDNLKNATPWVVKVAGVELLRDQVEWGVETHALHIATHFSNLVKVSERVVVRQTAGRALVRTLPMLRRDQRNEVVVELGKGLEMGQYAISKYIPEYLGEAALYLHPSELDEQVLWLKGLLGSPNDDAVSGALNTVAVLLQHYPAYRDRFPEEEAAYEHRREVLLGLLLQGLAHYREAVRQEALLVIGNFLFEYDVLSMDEKARLFALCFRKLRFLIQEAPLQADPLTFFYRAAALADIYRFIAYRRLDHGPFTFEKPRKVAFFPGTFDPFTLSHKGIVHAIRDLGFDVYLAVDEFSWSKKAQPHLIRRQIVNLSVAGDFNVHLFPDDIPVNIANPSDLKRMVELFPGQQVYLVAGSDVVTNASSYKAPPKPHSIHSMNHVIFHRAGGKPLPKNLPITGDIIHLHLPPHLEDISSTRIRENVDLNRDISNFIDPVIQDFIYQNGLYLRDRQDKALLGAGEVDFHWEREPDVETLTQVVRDRPYHSKDSLLLLQRSDTRETLGYISYRDITSSDLFSVMGDTQLANRIRLRAAGKTMLITDLAAVSDKFRDNAQLLLTELLARALEEEYVYAVYYPHLRQISSDIDDVLRRGGFTAREAGLPIREVDMRAPVVLIQNLETTIQEPLNRNPKVLAAIRKGHEQLQMAMTGLYPGSLVLPLTADIIHHRLLEKITAYNCVPSTPTNPRVLGESMCVPFGKLLRSKVVPNTVTKTIHTDKVFTPDLRDSTLEAFPNYSPLPSQIRTIKSFDRPVILVDDLMHPGFRLSMLDPILKKEQIDVRMVLVGVLSGYGKDLMHSWNRPVDSVYYIPNLKQWFVEATLYPFIGGNTVRRSAQPVPGLLPGINHILPYAVPGYEEECGRDVVFQISKTCLESALNLFRVLEQEYRALYGRNLTLSRLPEAVILPLCPDKGTCLHYDPNLSASVYLENDLEQLLRQYS